MVTYFDLAARPPDESWRSLRKRRSSPPVPKGSPQRQATFQTSLEQAEQQFRAAQGVSYESRALNLFYGISQAGRAVAAAAQRLSNNGWRLQGHGLSFRMEPEKVPALPSLNARISGGGNTAFCRLSEVLDSASNDDLPLGLLWRCLLEPATAEPIEAGSPYVALIVNPDAGRHPGGHDGPAYGITRAMVELPLAARDPAFRAEVTPVKYLDHYPGLRGSLGQWPPGHDVEWPEPGNDGLTVVWPADNQDVPSAGLRAGLQTYRRHIVALPAENPQSTGTMHPFMTWWSLLFSLSSLTRYFPDAWTMLIDVDRSSYATQLEFLLDVALTSVPDVIDEAIDLVST